MGLKAIVVGATGLIGQSLTHQLAAASHIDLVTTLTRRESEHDSPKVVNYVIDFDDLNAYQGLFRGDILFSCMGTTAAKAGSISAQRKVDLDYQFNVAELAAKQGVRHYLLVSSYRANANSPVPYLQMKGELEQKIKALPFERISIFQPSLLLGQREEARLGESISGWVMPAVCKLPGLRRYQPIEGGQMAAKMVMVSATEGEGVEYFVLDEIL